MTRAALLPALAFLAGAAPPGPVLEPAGLGAVRAGMTVAAAERALGAELAVDYAAGDGRHCGYATRTDSRAPGVTYMVVDGRIARVDIGTMSVRTARDVGIGSSVADVRKAYGAAVKASPHPYTGGKYLEVDSPDGVHGLLFEVEDGEVASMRGGTIEAIRYGEGCS